MPKTQVNCPQCRQPILADVQQLFDAGENTQDKQIFMSGMFNVAECPHCGYQGRLTLPLVYHDPDKELLLTYFPPELGIPLEEQQKSIGPIINRVVDRLPQEKRKGYLLSPKTMLTLQVMLENILEADGITKEMIQAQEERIQLIQKLLSASPEERVEIIEKEDEMINGEFFGLFARLLDGSIAGQDQDAAQQLNELQQVLLTNSTRGRELQSETQEVQAAMQSLQDLGEEITREKLLELVIKAPGDTRLRALVRFARQGMDYTFFQMLSERIDRARSKGRLRLLEIREKLLTYTQEVDAEHANRSEIAANNVERLLQADDIKAALEQNVEVIDEFFVQTVTRALDTARKAGNLDHSSRLQQILDVIEELSAPPAEFALIEELLEIADNESALKSAVESHSEEMTQEFLQMLNVLITRTQNSVENASSSDSTQEKEVLSRLEAVYKTVIGFTMLKNFQTGL
jgi:hypothetical protein